MSVLEEVASIRKKLDKVVSNDEADHAQALDLLEILRKLPLTLEILTKTRIGVSVNSFRKASKNEKCIFSAKSLIKDWKKLLEKDKDLKSKISSKSSNTANGKDDSPNSSSQSPKSPSKRRDNLSKASYTADQVRLKCREMLARVLQHPEFNIDFENLAGVIEDNIYKEFKNTDMKYKNRVRSRIFNLKDAKNPELKIKVLGGSIAPERLALMSSEEMASAEMKQLREKLTKEAIDDHQMAQQGEFDLIQSSYKILIIIINIVGTKTGAFKCNKCGERDTSYNQLQVKSADEPMTTFVLCNKCGNRWKFN